MDGILGSYRSVHSGECLTWRVGGCLVEKKVSTGYGEAKKKAEEGRDIHKVL